MQDDTPTQGEQPAAHIPEWEEGPASGFTLSRRTLLIGGGVLVVGGLLTGFSLNQQQQGYRGLGQAGTASTLENFTHFSALVTGFDVSELDSPDGTGAVHDLSTDPTDRVRARRQPARRPAARVQPTMPAAAAARAGAVTASSPVHVTSTLAITTATAVTGATAGTAGGTPVATLVAASARPLRPPPHWRISCARPATCRSTHRRRSPTSSGAVFSTDGALCVDGQRDHRGLVFRARAVLRRQPARRWPGCTRWAGRRWATRWRRPTARAKRESGAVPRRAAPDAAATTA